MAVQNEELEELMRVLQMYSHDAGRSRIVAALGKVLDLHREAFERVLAIAREHASAGFVERLRCDELLGPILVGYDLLPDPPGERAEAVLRGFRQRLAETGAGARVLAAGQDRVQVQLLRPLSGDAAALEALARQIEEALRAELEDVPQVAVTTAANLAYAETPRRWLPLVHRHELAGGEMQRVQLFEDGVILAESQGRVFAFRDRCPAGGESLEGSLREGPVLTCPAHGYHYELPSGLCRERPELSLDFLPVELEETTVKVAL